LLAFHVSNRYLDFSRLLAALATETGATAVRRVDVPVDPLTRLTGSYRSIWVAIAKDPAKLAPLGWKTVAPAPGLRPWTDDYSDVWSIRWR
jgi:hypothetical protein